MPIKGTSPAGLTFSAELQDEYLEGLPILVELTVENQTADSKLTADLTARPHLVHFKLVDPRGKTSERFTSPPQFDTGGEWTLAPRARRSVLLEIPSSAGFDPGPWKVNVLIGDGAQAVVLATHEFRLAPAQPVGGDLTWEPTIEKNSGAIVPWTHSAKGGFDVYLNQYAIGDSTRLLAHRWLFRSAKNLSPTLSRTLPVASRSRWLYWAGDPGELRVARIEGARLSGDIRSLGFPWSGAVPLARGVSDSRGGFALPLWVADPKGEAGSVRMLVMTERGAVTFRTVAEFARRPPLAETGMDANGNAILVLAHEKGIDSYRLSPDRDARLPLEGERAWKATADGWVTAGVGFDILPDKDGRAGGLAIAAVQLLPASKELPSQFRTLRIDLAGKLLETAAAALWLGPPSLSAFLPAGYAPFHYVGNDSTGQTVFGRADTAPRTIGKIPAATAWQAKSGTWSLRWLAGQRIVTERPVPE
ncbi:MAG: hypothetical protein EXR71_03000 [Myxococcales bacterium]|nr:hypothetical protein [Myxococcales bacterium]